MSVGSLPLANDVADLQRMGVGLVINMCREYSGPVGAYSKHGIEQSVFPTPDICEPRDEDILRSVIRIRAFLKDHSTITSPKDDNIKNNNSKSNNSNKNNSNDDSSVGDNNHCDSSGCKQNKVFIHCKAGRGRAATVALCYLISTGVDPDSAIRLLHEKRPVVEKSVRYFKVVERFIDRLARNKGNFDAISTTDTT